MPPESPLKIALRGDPQLRRRVAGKPIPRMIYPASAERRYVRALSRWVDSLMPDLNSAIARAVKLQTDRADAADWRTEIQRRIRKGVELSTIPSGDIEAAAKAVSEWNAKEVKRITRQLLGVNLIAAEPGLSKTLKGFAKENTGLIEKLKKNTFARIQRTAIEGVERGRSSKDIAKELREALGIERRHAQLLARDQVSKLNGELTETRQQGLGIEEYDWQTSGDERVRDTHRSKNGKRFKWSNPPSDTGHPGQDIQCRCAALGVIPNFEDL